MHISIFGLWKRLLKYISLQRRIQLTALILIMVLSTFTDLLSIGILLPFISLLLEPELANGSPFIIKLSQILNIEVSRLSLDLLTAMVILLSIAAGLVRLSLMWAQARVSASIGGDLSILVFERTMNKPYNYHVLMNSSQIISGVGKASSLIGGLIQPSAQILSSIILIFTTLTIVVSFQPKITIFTVGCVAILYFLIMLLLKPSLSKASRIIGEKNAELIKVVQEGLGAIKEVKINKVEKYFVNNFSISQTSYQRASADVQVMSTAPKFLLETIIICLIAALAFFYSDSFVSGSPLLPILGALTVGAQKLLPACQQLYYSWSAIQGGKASALDALDFLAEEPGSTAPNAISSELHFQHKIRLENISYNYGEGDVSILVDINLEIEKGQTVGIIGPSGAGKTTLVNIMMGLLQPASGRLLIDGKTLTQEKLGCWYSKIAHVPQSVYLFDASAEENISFALCGEEINTQHVRELMKQLKISGLGRLKDDFEKIQVGERGSLVSGGQMQRIGIGRALYKKAEILFLDEATSALDEENEKNLIKVIRRLYPEITLVFIAHKSSLLDHCDRIFQLEKGKLAEVPID